MFGALGALVFVLVEALVFNKLPPREVMSTYFLYKWLVHSILFTMIVCAIRWWEISRNNS